MKKKFYMISFPDAYYADLSEGLVKELYRDKSTIYSDPAGSYGYFPKPNAHKGSFEEWRDYRNNTQPDVILKEWPQYKSFTAVLPADKFLILAEIQMRREVHGSPVGELIDVIEEY